jgi:MYXO-CTERM domain-containing protein
MVDAAAPSGNGCDCPAGYVCIGLDNFCAGPCGEGNSCRTGYRCVGGSCVPQCMAMPCPSPTECDPATGMCVGSPSSADAGSPKGGSSRDAGKIGSGAGTSGAADAPTGDDHGCGCRTVGSDATTGWLGLGIASFLGLGRIARRRRS